MVNVSFIYLYGEKISLDKFITNYLINYVKYISCLIHGIYACKRNRYYIPPNHDNIIIL